MKSDRKGKALIYIILAGVFLGNVGNIRKASLTLRLSTASIYRGKRYGCFYCPFYVRLDF
jgi:hypothetical protein